MVVYGDVLFALNLLLDYAVLLASARIAACPFARLRLLGGALFGAVYAVAVFVPGLQILSALPLKLCAGDGHGAYCVRRPASLFQSAAGASLE